MLDHTNPRDDTRSAEDRARDRALLAASIRALKARLAPEALLVDAVALSVRGLGRAALRAGAAARANPAAAALTAAGLAWMAFGRGRRQGDAAPADDGGALAGSRYEALSRWADEGGPPPPEEDMPEPAAACDDWMAAADAAESRARAALDVLDAAARQAIAPAAEIARDRAAVLAERTADLAASFRLGLSDLSEAAQDRIAKAREAAFSARSLPSVAARAVRDRPEVAGAVALLAGAALAALWPRKARSASNRDLRIDVARDLQARERSRPSSATAPR
ncbi:MAG TPA: hypothetical protein PKD10_05075 [Paracoccaceae bacterium]|nr:hypothetical protein [Paracoccaceae bacterium]